MENKMISYAISVYKELSEINRLLSILKKCSNNHDEIIIVHTFKNEEEKTSKLFKDISSKCKEYCDIYENFHFQNNFADLKNYLIDLSTKDYIINLDADEFVSNETLKLWLKTIKAQDNDLYYIPRINTIKGYTLQDIKKYQWIINQNGWIQWPDYQPRIFQNNKQIRWSGKVHEHPIGFSNHYVMPVSPPLAILHHKQIEKQREQNNLYDQISSTN